MTKRRIPYQSAKCNPSHRTQLEYTKACALRASLGYWPVICNRRPQGGCGGGPGHKEAAAATGRWCVMLLSRVRVLGVGNEIGGGVQMGNWVCAFTRACCLIHFFFWGCEKCGCGGEWGWGELKFQF